MRVKKIKNRFNFYPLGVIFSLLLVSGFIVLKLSLKPPCANTLSCQESLELNIDNTSSASFGGEVLTPPKIDLAKDKTPSNVLGEAALNGEKHIYVDLASQTLSAYQGDTLFMQTLISSGKWFPTPTGDFKIWRSVRATKMSGGEGAGYYYLPNVPFVMFFSGSGIAAGRGFSLHGTYWHNNFGHAMSHGCVNMRTVDAEKIFYWADSDTVITIYGKAS